MVNRRFLDTLTMALPGLLAEATRKADQKAIRQALGARFEIYPQPQRTDGQWALWWAPYFRVLSDLPADAIELAMRAWEADPKNQWMPKPGEIGELARQTATPALKRYSTASRALREADAPKAQPLGHRVDPPALKTMTEKQRVMAMAADYRKYVEDRRPKPHDLPPIHGELAEGMGITPGLRDLMRHRWGADCFDKPPQRAPEATVAPSEIW